MTHAAIIPSLRYADALGAIRFLCDAFGFERHAVYADDKDPSLIHHAQLVRDGQMIMLSSAVAGDYVREAGMRTPNEAGGSTVALNVIVSDVDGHAERARKAGADIFRAPVDQNYGGRGYSARDPEGYIWNFGSYDPWAGH